MKIPFLKFFLQPKCFLSHSTAAITLFFCCLSAFPDVLKEQDLLINKAHADKAAESSVLYPPEQLKQTARFYADTETGKAAFEKLRKTVVDMVNDGDFKKGSTYGDYIFSVSLNSPGMLYFLTGNKEVGKFIHDRTIDLASRPIEFWLHAERFPISGTNPSATLQTGSMMSRVIPGIDLSSELFTSEEMLSIKKAIAEKGLIPCERFTKRKNINNWFAVISGGAFLAAKFTNNKKAEELMLDNIKKYLEDSIEEDGSYGEGPQYLLYPVQELLPAASAMSEEQKTYAFAKSPLGKSGEYLPYSSFFFNVEGKPARIQFRDGQQFVGQGASGLFVIGLLTKSSLVYDFAGRFDLLPPYQRPDYAILYNASATQSTKTSIESLPTFKFFNNGEIYIRSDWSGKGILFAMLSGTKNKTGFSHDRPARNGIALGAYGEYLLALPGHSSYRGKTYLKNDSTTHGNNAITIDGKNQLFPRQEDPLDQNGIPSAKIIFSSSSEKCDMIISDAAASYAEKPLLAIRAVAFVKNPGYFVIFDKIICEDKPHNYDSYWNFNNIDGLAKLDRKDDGEYLLQRPNANLSIFYKSDFPIKTETIQGIIHKKYIYSPEEADKLAPGTSKGLKVSSAQPQKEWNMATVLFPEKAASSKTPMQITGNGHELKIKLEGRSDKISFSGTKITCDINSK